MHTNDRVTSRRSERRPRRRNGIRTRRVLRITNPLLQSRVLRLGLLQDGDVGVGVFPEGEGVLMNPFFQIVEELFLAQKIEIGVAARAGVSDSAQVTGKIVGVATAL